MKWHRRTPLAWQNLTHNPRRLLVAVCGVNFAVVLMFMQTGFRNALYDSTVQIVENLQADIVLASKARYSLPAQQRFSLTRIYQARGCEGVRAVYPVYIEAPQAVWRQPQGKGAPIRVIATEAPESVFLIPGVAQQAAALQEPDTALMDLASKRKVYGIPGSEEPLDRQRGAELAGRAIRVVGTFELGTDFANDGNLILSTANFGRYFPQRAHGRDPLEVVDLGVLQVREGADPQLVKKRLVDLLPDDVTVRTKQELIDAEIGFWSRATAIGFVFFLGTVIGYIVGVIICYQIIHADVAEHMAEYATLKAIGYGDWYFVRVLLEESLYLSLLSFVPGVVISLVLYHVLAQSTGLLMTLTLAHAALIFLLTVAMCVSSGGLAMRKVLSADPADLF